MPSHFFNMVLYAFCVSIILALYFKHTIRDQVRFFIKMWTAMVTLALLLAWFMYILGNV